MLAPETKIISRVSNRTREPKDREVRSGKRRSDGCAKKRWVGAEEDTAPPTRQLTIPHRTHTLTHTSQSRQGGSHLGRHHASRVG